MSDELVDLGGAGAWGYDAAVTALGSGWLAVTSALIGRRISCQGELVDGAAALPALDLAPPAPPGGFGRRRHDPSVAGRADGRALAAYVRWDPTVGSEQVFVRTVDCSPR